MDSIEFFNNTNHTFNNSYSKSYVFPLIMVFFSFYIFLHFKLRGCLCSYLKKRQYKKYFTKQLKNVSIESIDTLNNEISCAICLNDYTDYDELIEVILLKCNHYYCRECIEEWYKSKNECPLCRKKLEVEKIFK